MTRRARLGLAAAIVGAVVAGAVWGPGWIRGGGAGQDQRALAGAGAPVPHAVKRRPVRVILVDGLSRDDTDRVPAYAAVCARGHDLIVDVGFPTKSLPIQLALWTGLTADQLGAPTVNIVDRSPPTASLAVSVPGSLAVVESYRFIAATAGFVVEPDASADAEDAGADPQAVRAWRETGFADAAERAAASDRRLVLIHILGVDEAAHHGGRSTERYGRALADADRVVARTIAATPAHALTIVLADHGHLPGGGHGDAEDIVRRVRACLAPSPLDAGVAWPRGGPGNSVHLVDLSRAIADALGVTLDPRAVGRPLALALAHPDRDATLPRPGGGRWTLALALAALVIAIGAYKLGRAGWVWSWPLAAYGIFRAAFGAPTLSSTPTLVGALLTAAPVVILVAAALRRHGRAAIAIAIAMPALTMTLVFAILSRIPDAIVTGVPPRTPWWTAHLVWAAELLALGALIAAVALVCPERGRAAPGKPPSAPPVPRREPPPP
jgi:hypothetical protein